MEKVFASIITIGDELLIGQVIDTNSAFIAQELNKAGILVRQRVAVGDAWEDIWQALDDAAAKSSLIIITGGLGPTADDITKPLLCEYFGAKMVVHPPTLLHLKHIFEHVLKRPMIERNAKQAEVPDSCTVLTNEKGTAPGMLFNRDGKIFISLPGVPHEMKWILTQQFMPLVPSLFATGNIVHRTLLTAGIGESYLAEMILSFETALPAHIKLAYLPNYGMVRLRLTGFGFDLGTLTTEIQSKFEELQGLVSAYLVTNEDIPMEKVVGNLLKAKAKTVATAESCTGGFIAHKLTSLSGSSAYYQGTVVSYSNTIKEKILSVSAETLLREGAVSEATVTEMARGVLQLMNTDYAIAVSGIMGPDGGSPEKPVGQVWIAIANKEKVVAQSFHFRFDRNRNIELTTIQALNLLRIFVIDND